MRNLAITVSPARPLRSTSIHAHSQNHCVVFSTLDEAGIADEQHQPDEPAELTGDKTLRNVVRRAGRIRWMNLSCASLEHSHFETKS